MFLASYACSVFLVIRIRTDHSFCTIFTSCGTDGFFRFIIFLQSSAVFLDILVIEDDFEVGIFLIVV